MHKTYSLSFLIGIRFFRNYPAIIAQSYSLFNEIPNFLVWALRNRCYADGFLRKNNGGTNRGPAVIFRLFRQARCAMSHSAICTAFSAAPLVFVAAPLRI